MTISLLRCCWGGRIVCVWQRGNWITSGWISDGRKAGDISPSGSHSLAAARATLFCYLRAVYRQLSITALTASLASLASMASLALTWVRFSTLLQLPINWLWSRRIPFHFDVVDLNKNDNAADAAAGFCGSSRRRKSPQIRPIKPEES